MTREKGKDKKLKKHSWKFEKTQKNCLLFGWCFHSISQSLKLPLVFVYTSMAHVHDFYLSNANQSRCSIWERYIKKQTSLFAGFFASAEKMTIKQTKS